MSEAPPAPAPDRPRWRRPALLALRLVVVAGVAVGLYFFLRGLRLHDLGRALRQAKLWPIALAAVLAFCNLFCRSLCWRVMLSSVARVPVRWLFRYTIAAFAASALAPARGGEVLRMWLLKRRDGVPMAVSAAVFVSERVLDVVAMLVVIAPLPWLMPGLPPWVGRALLLLLAVGLGAILVVRLAITRRRPGRFLQRFAGGFAILRHPGTFFLALLPLIGAWLLDLTAVALVCYAVGIHLPYAAGMLVLLTVNLAIIVPSTPGQVGVLEFGAMVGLEMLGVSREASLAFALLYHAMQVVPLLLVALVDLRFVLSARRAARAEAAGATGDAAVSAPADEERAGAAG